MSSTPGSGLFSSKTILVTGSGSGIGYAISKTLYNLGADVIAVSRSLDHLDSLKKECPNIQLIQVDLNNWNETREKLKNLPVLDGLVNSAGIAIIKPFKEFNESDFDSTFNVNIKAIFNVSQICDPNLRDGASIVNISSLASTASFDGHAVYSATKAAVDSLTRSLALELGPRKIRVNSVNPTVILTKMGRDNWSDPKKAEPLLSRIPLNRFGEVDEVVNAVKFLLSDESSFISGQHLRLEGGYSVH